MGASRMYFSVYSKINFTLLQLYQLLKIFTVGNTQTILTAAFANCNKGIYQTNKHVLSHGSSPSALNRYTKRHDAVLTIIVQWIQSKNPKNSTMHADIDDADLNQIVEIFQPNISPDLVIVQNRQIFVLELTVCHETYLVNSCKYKTEK